MTRIAVTVVVATLVAPLASCTQQSRSPEQQPPSAAVQARPIEGTVTQLSSNHGNVYTSIRPADYESLGLAAGKRVRVTFGDADAMTLVIGRDYADVPSGSPLAVLHREGLTFAIRDGNFSRTYGIDVGDTFRLSLVEPR